MEHLLECVEKSVCGCSFAVWFASAGEVSNVLDCWNIISSALLLIFTMSFIRNHDETNILMSWPTFLFFDSQHYNAIHRDYFLAAPKTFGEKASP